jgi:hypothetical protein
MQALIAAGIPASDPRITRALEYLSASQLDDGGWGFGSESNVSSTAYAVQALIAAGRDPEGATYRKTPSGPLDFILSRQGADGSFAGFDRAFATNQALPALARKSYCAAPSTPAVPLAHTRDVDPAPRPTPRAPAAGSGLYEPVKNRADGPVAWPAVALGVAVLFALAARNRARP